MPALSTAVRRQPVTLTVRQQLVVAAYASTSFSRDAALVLNCSIEEYEQELRVIRHTFYSTAYAIHSRQALIKSAQLAGYLPGLPPH